MARGSFDHRVDSAHRGKSAARLDNLAVSALKGVSAADKKKLTDALGIAKIRDLATDPFVQTARAIHEAAADLDHDPGPNAEWTAFWGEAPLATYQDHPRSFRLDFGPTYYRGRLDGTARLLIVGQDPAANELVGHRAFVGASGQRVQGFLRRIGILRDYLMVNTFLYPVFGQFFGDLRRLTEDPEILGYRNRLFQKIADENPLEAVIAIGAAAQDAVARWPGATGLHVQDITHPSARNNEALLANWNEGLAALRQRIVPEVDAPADTATYGTDWVEADLEPIPRRDLPFGMPEWHGVGSRATRARRKSDNKTDHKRIVWKAP